MPVYFEQCWSILSTIGIANVLFGWTVIGITGLSASTLIPIVVSAAGAVANGLCYYVYYESPPSANATAASAGADITWLVSSHQSFSAGNETQGLTTCGLPRSKKPGYPSTATSSSSTSSTGDSAPSSESYSGASWR